MKYSDQLADWLVEFGYTHCFYVGGGNIMHLTESLSNKMKCIPVIHEVAAGIAAEYFNEASTCQKAFALVTAGPGVTNIMTAIAGAFLESRELLVIGGQVKTVDLSKGLLRQNGIQEINGVALVQTICKKSIGMIDIWDKQKLFDVVSVSSTPRKGPVFIEIPLDIQGHEVSFDHEDIVKSKYTLSVISQADLELVINKIRLSSRPVIMLGGGIDRSTMHEIEDLLESSNIPVVTTWNAADRLSGANYNFCGRPNTWGQRSSNILLQQSDLLIAIGTRLGMQQTGFNWQEFIPIGEIIQVDIDKSELDKDHPIVQYPFAVDGNDFVRKLVRYDLGNHSDWLSFCLLIRKEVPLVESELNKVHDSYVSPYKFIQKLSKLSKQTDIIIPCSSGGAFTIMMQVFEQKKGQIIITDKGLASMGYGLSGAIGAAFSDRSKRVILVEGDGGFAQNLQEIGTAAINNLNMKVFIFNDGGYASIRSIQKNYFSGSYLGCDIKTNLGLPKWEALLHAWNVEPVVIDVNNFESGAYESEMNKECFSFFIVSIAPEQTYLPKIASKLGENGQMQSNPLHLMTPELSKDLSNKVFKYLNLGK